MKERDWTPSRLAKKAGLSHVYMSQLLRGVKTEGNKHTRVSIDTVTSLAKALGVPEQHLMLAYKGINPFQFGQGAQLEASLPSEVRAAALKWGVDLFTLPLETRDRLETSIINKTRKLMHILVQDELEQSGIIGNESWERGLLHKNWAKDNEGIGL